ncbi:hypothetical protein [Yinghuangia soli]|uniref:DUF732 domain-containing protein n=1 Tax=Yinghuangia soli TaxID=2908204 RepID=A0AA41U4M4_9ACTN|nr:hypothetical protein [Yinghuangia soli]MCF2533085.1 hypothetical protein [Yinghuangia soli]
MLRRAQIAGIGLVVVLVLAACQDADAEGGKPSSGATGTGSASPGPASSAPQPAPSLSGLPPLPDAETRAKYVAALEAVDPRIVGSDVDGVVERGRTTCRSIAANMNHAKLITETKKKFARTGYIVGTAHAEAIVRAANTHLCPSYGA